MEMINLSFLMEDVLSDFNRRHPSLRASFDIDNRILVKGSYDTLKGSVQSLIQGAIRFTDKSAHPCIVYGQVGCQQIHLMIDNGFGFKMDEMNDQRTTKKAAAFLPLGKTIKRVKVKHGGNVWGFAGEVIGAVFRFSPN